MNKIGNNNAGSGHVAQVTVKIAGQKNLVVEKGVTAQRVLEEFAPKTVAAHGEDVFAVKLNNEVCALNKPIAVNCTLEPVLRGSTTGAEIYRRSLCFLLSAAVHSALPSTRLVIGHSLGYSFYYTLENGEVKRLMQNDLALIDSKMREIVEADYPIEVTNISYADACTLFEQLGLHSAREKLRYSCPPEIRVNQLGDVAAQRFSEPHYGGPLLPRTGMLGLFSLSLYDEGFLLHFPSTKEPNAVAPFRDIPHLFSVYKQYKHWGRTLGVSTAAAINKMIHERTVNNLIDITELLQQKQIAAIADQIAAKKDLRVVLLAGPSSSGKTTSSKKLSLQLRVIGLNPKVIELDSYYVDRKHTPRDADGKYDYECLEALDVAQLGEDLDALFNGGEIKVPSYNFAAGERFYTGRTLCIDPGAGDILLLEGIHGLNDKLTPGVPKANKFKLYLSAITQLNLDDHNRVPTSDNRLIRRIVRDSQFRGKSAADTIAMWESVQRGEGLHIFPFQNDADAVLNTALDYELSVLKVFADPLLRCVSPLEAEYSEASRLLSFLDNFLPISPDYVPGQSIIREFIGNSDFTY